jgi:hypothetical protein
VAAIRVTAWQVVLRVRLGEVIAAANTRARDVSQYNCYPTRLIKVLGMHNVGDGVREDLHGGDKWLDRLSPPPQLILDS